MFMVFVRDKFRAMNVRIACLALLFGTGLSCHSCRGPGSGHASSPSDAAAGDAGDAGSGTTLEIENKSSDGVEVYVAFGAHSIITPTSPEWEFCTEEKSYPMVCDFSLGPDVTRVLPLAGTYFNAAISFGGAVTCGTTKAEFDLNSTTWYDVMDLSLVDGFNAALSIEVEEPGNLDAGPTVLGPVLKERGNERAFGVFPLACDVCVARQSPPCGYSRGPSAECKKGSQSDPDVVCQYQATMMHGADTAVKLVFSGMPGREILHVGLPDEKGR